MKFCLRVTNLKFCKQGNLCYFKSIRNTCTNNICLLLNFKVKKLEALYSYRYTGKYPFPFLHTSFWTLEYKTILWSFLMHCTKVLLGLILSYFSGKLLRSTVDPRPMLLLDIHSKIETSLSYRTLMLSTTKYYIRTSLDIIMANCLLGFLFCGTY